MPLGMWNVLAAQGHRGFKRVAPAQQVAAHCNLSSLEAEPSGPLEILDVVLVLRLGDWGMGQIFSFALLRHRVVHGALRMRLRSHVRSAVKTASWRAFAAVDTFGLVWLFSGHDATHAIAAASAVVGVEAITKSFLYFAHERLWEAPAFSTRRANGAHAHHFQSQGVARSKKFAGQLF
jgi:uncharacterized membrane protein